MRLLITGDLHLSINPRDDYRFAFMKKLRKIAKLNKPEYIIIAGDLTEEKDRHPAILVNRVVDEINEFAQICPVIIDQGNHDYKEEGHAFFEFTRRIPNVRWVSKPLIVHPDILVLPHTMDYKTDWAGLDLADYPVIICHQTFANADIGFGRKLDGIPIEILPKRSRIFCGDIHVPQEFGKNLIYIGAPYHVDFGDNYKARIISVLEDARNWLSVDVSHYPQKRAVHIDDAGQPDPAEFNTGDLLKITVDVADMGGWQPLKDQIKKGYEEQGARVWSISPKLISKATRKRHVVKDAGQSDHELLDTFGKRMDLSPNTMKVGRKLL